MYKGSCLCGKVTFELATKPKAVTHCHCKMCQKQHGAAFATYGSVPKAKFCYLTGQNSLTTYHSSNNVKRKFCSLCGSNIEWSSSENYPEWICISMAALDTPFNPKTIKQVNTGSKVCWL